MGSCHLPRILSALTLFYDRSCGGKMNVGSLFGDASVTAAIPKDTMKCTLFVCPHLCMTQSVSHKSSGSVHPL
jgi:hypothetical protein